MPWYEIAENAWTLDESNWIVSHEVDGWRVTFTAIVGDTRVVSSFRVSEINDFIKSAKMMTAYSN